VTRLRRQAIEFGNNDVFRDTAVLRHHEMYAGITLVDADQLGHGALDHLDNARLALAKAIASFCGDQHPVTVHHRQHLPRRDKQVFHVTLFGNHEAETIAMPLDTAADQVHTAGQPVLALAVLDQLAVTDHGAEASLERYLVVFFSYAKRTTQLTDRQGLSLVVEQLDDQFAAGDGVVVAGRFASGV